MQTSD